MEEVYGIKIHSRLAMEVSFQDWVERWNNCKDSEAAVGLLHSIYSANKGEAYFGLPNYREHRHLFLLKLADGHRDDRLDDKLPRFVRYKAFRMLAGHLFKGENALNPILALSKELTERLLTFFGIENPLPMNVYWDPGDHSDSQHADALASAFMQNFCAMHWDNQNNPELRLKILELLYVRKKLHSLFPKSEHDDRGNVYEHFDEPVCKKLQELALRDDPSIEEGVAHGSRAATLLVLARAAQQGIERAERQKQIKASILEKERELASLR